MSAKNLQSDELVALMAGCPNQWFGDEGFISWAKSVYQKGFDAGAASTQPAAHSKEERPEKAEPKPEAPGTFYGQKSPRGAWFWKGTGTQQDQWISIGTQQEHKHK